MSAPTSAASRLSPEKPWLGLGSFTAAEASFFFGREDDIALVSKCVRRAPLTLLYGSSGRGKSSLIGAGLIPDLQHRQHSVTLIRHDYDSLRESDFIPLVMRRVSDSVAQNASQTETPTADTLWEFFHDRRQPWCAASQGERPVCAVPVLIFDQFEEIFTKGEDITIAAGAEKDPDIQNTAQLVTNARAHATTFLHQLADLVENRVPASLRAQIEQASRASGGADSLLARYDFDAQPVNVVLVLREDFLARLERLRDIMPALMQQRVELPALTGAQALDAVMLPGMLLDPEQPIIPEDIAARIVRAAASVPEDTPLEKILAVSAAILSLLCEELNEKRLAAKPPSTSVTSFTASSVDTILESFYEKKMPSDPALRAALEDRLAPAGIREKTSVQSIIRGLPRPAEAETLIRERLQDDRILVVDDHDRVEFTHDKLAEIARRKADARAEIEAARASSKRWRTRALVAMTTAAALLALGWVLWLNHQHQLARQAEQQRARDAEQRTHEAEVSKQAADKRLKEFLVTLTKDIGPALMDPVQAPLKFWTQIEKENREFLQREPSDLALQETQVTALQGAAYFGRAQRPRQETDILYQQAFTLLEARSKREPSNPEHLKTLGAAYWWLADLHVVIPGPDNKTDPITAALHMDRAVEYYDRAAKLEKDPRASLLEAAKAAKAKADVLQNGGNLIEAIPFYDQAILRWEKLNTGWKAWIADKNAPIGDFPSRINYHTELLRRKAAALLQINNNPLNKSALQESLKLLNQADEMLAGLLSRERRAPDVEQAAMCKALRSAVLTYLKEEDWKEQSRAALRDFKRMMTDIKTDSNNVAGFSWRVGQECNNAAANLHLHHERESLLLGTELAVLAAEMLVPLANASNAQPVQIYEWIKTFSETGLMQIELGIFDGAYDNLGTTMNLIDTQLIKLGEKNIKPEWLYSKAQAAYYRAYALCWKSPHPGERTGGYGEIQKAWQVAHDACKSIPEASQTDDSRTWLAESAEGIQAAAVLVKFSAQWAIVKAATSVTATSSPNLVISMPADADLLKNGRDLIQELIALRFFKDQRTLESLTEQEVTAVPALWKEGIMRLLWWEANYLRSRGDIEGSLKAFEAAKKLAEHLLATRQLPPFAADAPALIKSQWEDCQKLKK